MKKLYEFTAYKKIKNEKGEDKYEAIELFLRKPNRILFEEEEMFYGVALSNCIKEGLLTRNQLSVKFADELGTLSQRDKETYINSVGLIKAKESEYQALSLKKEEERSKEENDKIKSIIKDITDLREVLQNIESSQQSLYEHTAETISRNKTVLWWLFQLSFFKDEKPFFGEGDYKAKLKTYDDFAERDDDFYINLSRKMLLLVTAWYTGRIEDKEDFDVLANTVGLNKNPEEKLNEIQPEIVATQKAANE